MHFREMSQRRWGSIANRSVLGKKLMSNQVSPKKMYNCLNNQNQRNNKAFSDELNKKAETLKTIENRIRENGFRYVVYHAIFFI